MSENEQLEATTKAPSPNSVAPALLESRRDLIIQRLSDGFVEDRFDVDEYESRLDRAHRATDLATLDALVSDVPASTTESAIASATAPTHAWALAERVPDSGWAVACFGGTSRSGQWAVPKSLKVVATFGGVDLDFREARFESGVTDVFVLAVMGGADIVVPPDIAVECNGIAIMGGFDDRSRSTPDASDRPVLRIHGAAVMGGVDVVTRLPGETPREARKRLKKERTQRQLPAGHEPK